MDISEVIKNICSQRDVSQEDQESFRLMEEKIINRNQIRLQDTLWQNFVGKIIWTKS